MMRRWISILLCLCMLLALTACANAEGSKETAAEEKPSFRVGYSKVDITPAKGTALYGYTSDRVIEEVWDHIYLTCVAITDEKDNTVLMYSQDLMNMKTVVRNTLTSAVESATGIPASNMFFTSTHNHSAPSPETLGKQLQQAAVQTAEEALEDRKPAEMYFGTAETTGINFVRHYFDVNGKSVTDNHGDYNAELTGHTSQIDQEMRVLQFKREGGKDVILANWQCHNHLTSGQMGYRNVLTADMVGMMRMYMEQDLDCLFAFYQGGAGNVNPQTRIESELFHPEYDYKLWGQSMANTAMKALQNMTQVPTGEIKVLNEIYTAGANKEGLDPETVEAATKVVEYFEAGHDSLEAKVYGESLNAGIYSYYHAADLLGRIGNPETFDMPINVISIGDFAWSTAPGEFFDVSMKYVRDNSPFTYNFTTAYTNDSPGYVPTQEAWEYGCYEVDVAAVERGTAEKVTDRLLEMLNILHGE